jgi:hypothetical protein
MNGKEAIAMLEQHIARLEITEADPNEEKWQLLTGLLQRVKAGDEAAIQEASDLLST